MNYESRIRIKDSQSGFTLVELLVVIGVIAFLIAVVFPNFMGMRERARDTQRKSDLTQIQKALELYKMNRNPVAYIDTADFAAIACGSTWADSQDADIVYIQKFPCDPGGTNVTTYLYQRNVSDNLKYTLTACLENEADPDRDGTTASGCSTVGASYTVSEP